MRNAYFHIQGRITHEAQASVEPFQVRLGADAYGFVRMSPIQFGQRDSHQFATQSALTKRRRYEYAPDRTLRETGIRGQNPQISRDLISRPSDQMQRLHIAPIQ